MRALLSVADREGLAPFARGLDSLGVELFATDGTREALAADGLGAGPVSALTNVPPLAGGQVKTFHPAVYAGILARRDRPEQLAELIEHGIAPIDIVVVNVTPLAPLEGDAAAPLAVHELVERIDVGGVALLSAAARNYAGVTAVSSPAHYPAVLAELRERGSVSAELRQRLAADAFATVAAYNAEVAAYLNHIGRVRFPRRLTLALEKAADLPYGENPQQQAAFYRQTGHRGGSLVDAVRLQGGQQTFNDLLDLDAALRIVSDFTAPTVAIVKRGNPVGLASNDTLAEAYVRALAGDPVEAFGATLAINRPLDEPTARQIVDTPYEAVLAPGADPAAQLLLAEKPELAVLIVPATPGQGASDDLADLDLARISGGLLVETIDRSPLDRASLRVVTERRPTLEELTDLMFAWRAVRHVRSNGVVLARGSALVGLGAGQASRLVAVEIGLHRAAERAKLSVLASDAYFPFADAIQLAAERGVTAIIQPGGSRRDAMAIEVADRHHMAMVFTGRRYFRH